MDLKFLEKYTPDRVGLLQALGVTLYCTSVSLIFSNGEKLFGGEPNKFLGPVMFLLLFSFSVLFCALVVFYRPYILFFENKKKEAIDIVVHTAAWLFAFFLLFLTLVLLLR